MYLFILNDPSLCFGPTLTRVSYFYKTFKYPRIQQSSVRTDLQPPLYYKNNRIISE